MCVAFWHSSSVKGDWKEKSRGDGCTDLVRRSAQDAPPYTLKDYGYKRVSDDIAELARQLGCKQIILGGHDWYERPLLFSCPIPTRTPGPRTETGGGHKLYFWQNPHLSLSACVPRWFRRISLNSKNILLMIPNSSNRGGAIVYRAAQYHPTLITHLFSICTPYFPPSRAYEPLHLLVAHRLPNFGYQEHFASGELEEALQSRAEIKHFLNGMYGARGPNGEVAFDATKGVFLANLPKLGMNKLLTEAELDYYAQEYARHGLHGPLNWYRNREVNYVEELEFFFKEDGRQGKEEGGGGGGPRVEQEVLFVLATKDQALKPHMAAKMEERIGRLTRREVTAGHWALWEKPEEVNAILKEWFDGVVFGGKSKL